MNVSPNDPVEAHETLYMRIAPGTVADGKVQPQSVRAPDTSVNRSALSVPEDVLRPNWPDHGIAAFLAGRVPPSLQASNTPLYEFRVEPDPEENNPAHCEIRAFKGGERCKDIAKTLKLLYRQQIADIADVLRLPRDLPPSPPA